MSRKLKLWSDPYCTGYDLYAKKSVELKPGVTVLVGCNGIGKSTFLSNIKDILQKEDIPYISFDNLNDGGANARSTAGFFGDFNFLGTSLCSSEGENIVMNLGRTAGKIGNFVRKNPDAKELWVLLDAVDSGLSIDNVVDIKKLLFKEVLEDPRNKDKDVYIIVSANAYEMARNEQCLDVYHMKYVTIPDYDAYREFVIKSKEWKTQREEKERK